jgi:hypothetical protein
MPGARGYGHEDKDEKVQLRVPASSLARWRAYVEKRGGYLSVLIRRAVDEHLAANEKSKDKAPQIYEWPERRRRGY